MKIAVISSVPPDKLTSGEIVIYRHLKEFGVDRVEVLSDRVFSPDFKGMTILPSAFWERLKRTRIAWLLHYLDNIIVTPSLKRKAEAWIRDFKPDVILTVACGEFQWLALICSQKFRIPLVTVFHDWWPDMVSVCPWMRKTIEHRYRRLASLSDVNLCVSGGMINEIGLENARLLYPIPSRHDHLPPISQEHYSPLITYIGNASDIYAPQLRGLVKNVLSSKSSDIKLQMFGSEPTWPQDEIAEVKGSGIYGGFLSGEALSQVLRESSFLLVVMSFDESQKRRMITSFPSKIPEYCAYSKPIIIWGPEYSSAVHWARESGAAVCVTDSDPAVLIREVSQLVLEPRRIEELALKARDEYETRFYPEKLQQLFEDSIRKVGS